MVSGVSGTFGDRLRELRVSKGWTLRDLAGEVSYSYSYLSKLERGAASPSVEAAGVLDEVLGAGGDLVDLAFEQGGPEQLPLNRPRELVPGVADFVGRREAMGTLDEVLAGPGPRECLVVGAPGVGKSELVRHWGHRVAHEFPDGQLVADLRAWGSDGPPARPAEVLEEFFSALGIPRSMVPDRLDRMTRLWRAVLATRRILVVLDNATSEQVLPLRPPQGTRSVLVVTSRADLGRVTRETAAPVVRLGWLSREESVELLGNVAGQRVAEERQAAERIAVLCGDSPLAIRFAGQRADLHPHRSLADLAAELEPESTRLDLLADPDEADADVRDSLAWSYDALDVDTACLLRLMGAHGAAVSVAGAAALAGTTLPLALRRLERLQRLHLIVEVGADQYECPELLRLVARERASAAEVQQAHTRWLDWLLHSVVAANQQLAPQWDRPSLDQPSVETSRVMAEPSEPSAAWQWCVQEMPGVVDAIAVARELGRPELAWKLAVFSVPWAARQKHWHVWLSALTRGLEAARDAGDQTGQSWCQHHLGLALVELRRWEEALAQLRAAAAVRRDSGDRRGCAWSAWATGIALVELGRTEDADTELSAALNAFHELDCVYGAGWARTWLGVLARHDGRYADARDWLRAAGNDFESVDARDGEVAVLVELGELHRLVDQPDRALDCLERGLRTARALHDAAAEGECLLERGLVLQDQGQVEAAREDWQEALTVFESVSHPRASSVRTWLATEAHRTIPCGSAV